MQKQGVIQLLAMRSLPGPKNQTHHCAWLLRPWASYNAMRKSVMSRGQGCVSLSCADCMAHSKTLPHLRTVPGSN